MTSSEGVHLLMLCRENMSFCPCNPPHISRLMLCQQDSNTLEEVTLPPLHQIALGINGQSPASAAHQWTTINSESNIH